MTANRTATRPNKRAGLRTPRTFDGDEVVQEGAGEQAATYTRGPGGQLLSVRAPAQPLRLYHHDALGSVTGLSDERGAQTDSYAYDSFGMSRSSSGSSANPFRYMGNAVGPGDVYDFHARSYDAATGRFTSKDPVAGAAGLSQTLNPYPHGVGNPQRYPDPGGAFPPALAAASAAGGGEAPVSYLATDPSKTSFDTCAYGQATGDSGSRDALETVSDTAAAFSDGATAPLGWVGLPTTHSVRDSMGTNQYVDFCSGWYAAGRVAGYAADAALVSAGGLAATGFSVEFRYYVNARGIGGSLLGRNGQSTQPRLASVRIAGARYQSAALRPQEGAGKDQSQALAVA